jgi:hypothetical protein
VFQPTSSNHNMALQVFGICSALQGWLANTLFSVPSTIYLLVCRCHAPTCLVPCQHTWRQPVGSPHNRRCCGRRCRRPHGWQATAARHSLRALCLLPAPRDEAAVAGVQAPAAACPCQHPPAGSERLQQHQAHPFLPANGPCTQGQWGKWQQRQQRCQRQVQVGCMQGCRPQLALLLEGTPGHWLSTPLLQEQRQQQLQQQQ